MPFLSCFISVVKEKSGELAASLPPDHPILVSACYKSQEGYRFASVALRPFHVILVILNYLSKGHGWIDCIHHRYTSFLFGVRPSQLSYVIWADMFEMIFSFLVYIITPSLVVFNKNT